LSVPRAIKEESMKNIQNQKKLSRLYKSYVSTTNQCAIPRTSREEKQIGIEIEEKDFLPSIKRSNPRVTA
jgi:hypothetical protein